MAKEKLVENISLSSQSYFRRKQETQESVIRVTEQGNPQEYKALAVYTFPISRPDQRNLNNRIYSSKLWENVIRNKQGEGVFGLMDHPSDDGSVKDTWCVWRNLRFSEDRKLILCDAYLFGNWGKQVLEALEAGGRIGLSSSGYGEFLSDNTTLDPDSFELERVADFVLNPSYQVFGTQEDLVLTESIQHEQEKSLEFSPKEKIEENKMENAEKKLSPSLEEKRFNLNIKSMFKENQQIEDIERRIVENQNLVSYFDETPNELKASIEEAIQADQNAILEGYRKSLTLEKENEDLKKALEEKASAEESVKTDSEEKFTEQINKLSEEKQSLEKEFENACTLLDSMREYVEKQDELLKLANAEKNGMVKVSDYKEAIVYGEELESQNKNLKKQISALRAENRNLKDSIKELESDISLLSEEGEETDPEVGGEEEGDIEEKKKCARSESSESYSFRKGVSPEVQEYYEDLVYRNPKVVKIKEEILAKHTLIEAQKTYLKLRALVEDNTFKLSKVGKNTFVEEAKKPSLRREGWL